MKIAYGNTNYLLHFVSSTKQLLVSINFENISNQGSYGYFKSHLFYLVYPTNTSETTLSIKETSVGNDSVTDVSDSSSKENGTTASVAKDPEEDSTEGYDYTENNVQIEDSTGISNNETL